MTLVRGYAMVRHQLALGFFGLRLCFFQQKNVDSFSYFSKKTHVVIVIRRPSLRQF